MKPRGLVLREVAISRAGRRLLGPLSLTVAPGTATTVMGPSGVGKSTLLAWICGTLPPIFQAEGAVLLNGEELGALPPERRRIGLLLQDPLLFPHLSVAGNLAFGLPAALGGRRARRRMAEAALAEVGLQGFAARDPATLSGGQAARVALLRTLLAEPGALLLDEPFSRLDTPLRSRMRDLVFARARDRGLPVLLVTHDPQDAAAAGGPVLQLTAA